MKFHAPPHRGEAGACREGSGIFVRALALRECLVELTDALAHAGRDDVVLLDLASAHARIVPPEAATMPHARRVPRPDGLWEWSVRRDFVRALRRERRKEADRLAATLGGPRSRQRFITALTTIGDEGLVRAFDLHRRRRLRAWSARILRAALAE